MRKCLLTPLSSPMQIVVVLLIVLNHVFSTPAAAASKSQQALPNATLGVYYSVTVPPGNASWKLVSGSLPPGLALSGSTVAGIPEAVGQYAFTAQNTSSNGGGKTRGSSSTSNFSIAVLNSSQLSITTTSLPDATAGVAYSQTLTASAGIQPYSWFVISGSLPPGLALSTNTGTISGTPTSGTYSFTVQVQDSSSPLQSATQNLSIVVVPGTQNLAITTTSLPNGTAAVAYSQTLTASGGTQPYSWSVASGSLPPGLSLSTNSGTISGTPTSAATYSFTVQVQDSSSPLQSAIQSLSIVVASGTQNLAITTTSLPNGTVGTAYSSTVSATGGTTPYSWSVVSGQVPPGLSLNATTGNLAGTPSSAGNYNFTVQVTDSSSQTATQAFTVAVSSTTTSLDQYGGRTDIGCAGGATGYFYKEKINNRWWLCTPAGHAFFYQGIYGVDYSWIDGNDPQGVNGRTNLSSKYAGADWRPIWAPAAVNRLQSWGFNATVNSSSHVWPTDTDSSYTTADHSIPVKLPFITSVLPGLGSMRNQVIVGSTPFLPEPTKGFLYAASPVYNGLIINWRGWQIADWYDPKIATWLQQDLANDPKWAAIKGSTYGNYLIGISCEDADNSAGFQAGDAFQTSPPNSGNPNLGWLAATMSPIVVAETQPLTGAPEVFSDTTMYTKKAWHDYLAGKYGTIAALNSAWGSAYTTFDSTGTPITGESLGMGDGSTTTFTKTLAHTGISPYTIAIRVNGMLVGGDCPSWTWACSAPVQGQAILLGPPSASPAVASGYIDFNTGSLSLTFSAPPASLATVTVDYIYGGWNAGGTGLMDEDGRASHQGWIGNDDKSLSNASSAVRSDMNTFLEQLAEQFFATCASGIKAAFPHTLYLGPDSLFTWNVPSRAQVLTAAAKYLDAAISYASVPFTSSELSYIYQYAGDLPIIEGIYIHANPDSPYNQYVDGSYTNEDFGTQERKGQQIYNFLSTDRNATYPNGSYPYIGSGLWSYFDSWGEQKNWGLVTWRDNAYDGHEDVFGNVTCSSPLTAFACGGEDSTPYPTWQAAHAYTARTNRVIATVNGTTYYYEAQTTGTSGSSQPTWPATLNATVADGGITWMNVGPKTNPNGYGDAITSVKKANALWLQ